MKNSIYILFVFLASCAQMVPPSGGPKDITAPSVIEEKTFPKNKSVNFNSKSILISFDEYVKLNNPNDNIIISPALEKKPDFVLKGKKLMVKFNSELKSNTTYTINFGNSITDITENNPAAGLTYVFSTGPELDSLRIQGQVFNSLSNQPEKNVWVVLHKNLSDSSLQKLMPDYLTKTDNNGNYSLQNLAAGDYHIYALKDGNSDYKYNQTNEEIAFLNEIISLTKNLSGINLRLFKEDKEKQYVKSSQFIWPGKLRMIMNKPYDSWFAYYPGDDSTKKSISSIYKSNSMDTIDVWAKKDIVDSNEEIKIILKIKEDSITRNDTIRFSVPTVKKIIPKLKLKSNASGQFSLYDKLRLRFDRPAGLIDESKMLLYKNDSIPVKIEQKSLAYGITLNNAWEEKTDYTLILQEGAFKELYYGMQSEADTIKFTTVRKDFYGNIIAKINVPEGKYVLELTGAGDKLIFKDHFSESKTFSFDKLKPGSYKMKIIEDKNENGKWDTGNLLEKTQPEKMYYYKEPIVIRSNWDFDLTWKIEK